MLVTALASAVVLAPTAGAGPAGPPLPTWVVDIGHRGAAAYAPEETTASYDLARKMGADYLEQDAHLTADGYLVAIHDDTLDRTARGPRENCTGLVWTKTLAQLKTCDMGSWFNETYPKLARKAYVGLRIQTLDEIIDRYGTNRRYYIETKSPEAQPGMEEALLATLARHGLVDAARTRRQVLIQSFSPDSLVRIHQMDPALPLIQLTEGGGPLMTGPAFTAIHSYAVGIGPPSSDATPAYVAAAHDACLDVHPFTVDDAAEMRDLIAAGVDGMFTNRPDVLRSVIEATGRAQPPAHCR